MERSQMVYNVYVGMDVGKCEDYVVALARDGDERLIDSPVSQSECDLRAVLAVAMSYGKPLLVVDRLHARIALELLARYGGPAGFRRAGLRRCSEWAGKIKNQRNVGPAKVAEVFDAISAQSVADPAAPVAEQQVRRLCKRILELNRDIAEIEASVASRSADIPATAILRSIPGIGEGNAAVIASQVDDVSRFRSADALASYAGLAPRKRQSSKSLNKTTARKGGNRVLKNAIVQSVQIALTWDDPEKGRYWKKRAEGKKHKQAIRALARRRVEVIYAMPSTGSFYEPSTAKA